MIDHFFGVTLALVLHIHWFQSGFPSDYSTGNMDSQICPEVIQTAIKCPDVKHKTKVNLFLKVEYSKKQEKIQRHECKKMMLSALIFSDIS